MNRDLYRVKRGVVVNVVHVGQRQDARVSAGAANATSRFSSFEVSFQQVRRESTRPLIEITECKPRCSITSAIIHDLKQFL